MSWQVTFYSPEFRSELLQLPAGFVARFLRYAERMEIYGPNCTLIGRRIVMLHQFVKKSEKTPRKELEIARWRMKETKDAQRT